VEVRNDFTLAVLEGTMTVNVKVKGSLKDGALMTSSSGLLRIARSGRRRRLIEMTGDAAQYLSPTGKEDGQSMNV